MAYLLPNYVDSFGTMHEAAYLRITDVQVSHTRKTAVVNFAVYASAATAKDGKSIPIGTNGFAFVDEGESTIFTDFFGCTPNTEFNATGLPGVRCLSARAQGRAVATLRSGIVDGV